jgi:AraC-like DNA-binding protein
LPQTRTRKRQANGLSFAGFRNTLFPQMLKKILKHTLRTLLIILLVLLLVPALIYVPAVQDLARRRAVAYASRTLGMEVSVERIRLAFPLRLTVDNTLLADRTDTLLRCGRLSLDAALWPLIRKEVAIRSFALERVAAHYKDTLAGMDLRLAAGELSLEAVRADLSANTAGISRLVLADADIRLNLFDTAGLRETEDVNRAKEPGYELFIKGALLRFLALLIAQGKNLPPMETADSRRLKKILQWVADHYGEEVHISDAAQLVPCSESHFMRWFRQMTGQSFIAFLKEYRLNAAAEALHTTDDTVLSIASRCGFENLSYFNRAFKAHFGLTPREHRKK